MKRLSALVVLVSILSVPAIADDYDELYGRWYAGDWVSKAEDFDGRKVWYGLRIEKGNEVHGCIIYPGKNGMDRKLFGQIIDTGANDLEIRLSNGRQIEFQERGKAPRNSLKLTLKRERTRIELEFNR